MLDWRQIGTGRSTDERFALAPPLPTGGSTGSPSTSRCPFRVARELRRFRPDAVLAQGAAGDRARPARAAAGPRADEGDPRRPRRLARADAALRLALRGGCSTRSRDALARLGLRRADGIRTISGYTTGSSARHGREPDAEFPAYMDLDAVPRPAGAAAGDADRALRRRARALQGVDVLAEAWPTVRRARPRRAAARRRARARCPRPPATAIEWTPIALDGARSSAALDAATLLVLPSRSEGLGRVSSRRSAAAAASSAAASAGSPTSSATARPACSSSRETPRRSPTRSSASSRDPELAGRFGAVGTQVLRHLGRHARGVRRAHRRRSSSARH